MSVKKTCFQGPVASHCFYSFQHVFYKVVFFICWNYILSWCRRPLLNFHHHEDLKIYLYALWMFVLCHVSCWVITTLCFGGLISHHFKRISSLHMSVTTTSFVLHTQMVSVLTWPGGNHVSQNNKQVTLQNLSPFTLVYFSKRFLKSSVLGMLEKLQKVTISYGLSVCPSICPHGMSWLSPDQFSRNLTFAYFSKVYQENSSFIKVGQE